MASQAERTALLFLVGVVLAGGLVRAERALRQGRAPAPAADAALEAQRRLVDSARIARDATRRAAATAVRPSGTAAPPRPAAGKSPTPGQPHVLINVNVATAAELEALPRVGPALARRIVEEREANGPFAGLAALQERVRGVGPVLVAGIERLVVFSPR